MEYKHNSNPLDVNNDVKVLRVSRYFAPDDFIFKIQSFSSLLGWPNKRVESSCFESGGFKWRLCLLLSERNEKQNVGEYISLYLSVADVDKLPIGWEINVNVKLFLFNQIKNKYISVQDGRVWRFHCLRSEWGFEKLLALSSFSDPANGYLVGDSCGFGAEIYVINPTNNATFESVDLSKILENPVFTWKIKDYSKSETIAVLWSPDFTIGGFKWKLKLYPKGFGSEAGKSISIFLHSFDVDSASDLELEAKYKLRIKDQLSGGNKERAVVHHTFCSADKSWGYPAFMPIEDLKDAAITYLHDDSLIVEIEFVYLSKTQVICKEKSDN